MSHITLLKLSVVKKLRSALTWELMLLTPRVIIALVALGAVLIGEVSPAHAAEIRLLSAAAMQSVFKEIAIEFERTSEHKLNIEYATMGAINQRILAGDLADLVIGSTPSISSLVKVGKILPYSQIRICKVGVGVVVSSADLKPKIDTVEN